MQMRVLSLGLFCQRAGRTLASGIACSGLLALAISGPAVPPVDAQTTVPVLWTAGGLDAGTTGAGQAARMAVDALGNVAVVSGPSGGRDLQVTSYTPDGTLRWRGAVSPSAGTFLGDWVATAPDGEVIAVGHNVNSSGTPIAITMVRFTFEGTLRWRADFSASFYPSVGRLVVDAAGNAYVAWSAVGSGMFVQKYSPSGGVLWTQQELSGGGYAVASSLALSPDGADVIATGSVSGGATWITASYGAATGTRTWLVTAAEGTAARDVVVDATRVYVTGQGVTGAGTPALAYWLTVVAYDRQSGARLWRRDMKPADAGSAAGLRMALAPDGSLAVTGQAARGFLDWYTVGLETTGAVRWQAVRDGGLNTDEIPRAVLVQTDGTTVVTGPGGPNLPGGYIPGVTVGYGPGGTLLWEAFSRMGTVWADALPSGDACATGGYDALITCWRLSGGVTPPAAPSSLTARLSAGAILLAWQDNATDETAFSVERSVNTGTGWSSFVVLATLGANATSYRDTSFTAASYAYRVRASNAGGDSAYSNTATISIVGANDPPIAVMSVTPASGTAPLAVAFDGSGSTDLGGFVTSWAWAFGDGTTGTGVTATHVYSTPGTYVATLTVTDNGGLSGTTSTSIVVSAPPPTAPTGLTATALSAGSIRLRWTNTAPYQSDVRIERCRGSNCTSFAQVAIVAGTATTFTNTGLLSRTTYTYRVRAHNAAGDSPYSNVASARTTR